MAALSYLLKVRNMWRKQWKIRRKELEAPTCSLSPPAERAGGCIQQGHWSWPPPPEESRVILRTLHLRHRCAQDSRVPWLLRLSFPVVDKMALGVGKQKPPGRNLKAAQGVKETGQTTLRMEAGSTFASFGSPQEPGGRKGTRTKGGAGVQGEKKEAWWGG